MFNLFKKNFNQLLLILFMYISYTGLEQFTLFKDSIDSGTKVSKKDKISITENNSSNRQLTKKIITEKIVEKKIEIAKFSSPDFFSDSEFQESITNDDLIPVGEKILFSGIPIPKSKPMPQINNYTKHYSASLKNSKELQQFINHVSSDIHEERRILNLVKEEINFKVSDNLKVSFSKINGSEILSEISVFKNNLHEVNIRRNTFGEFISQFVRAPTERKIVRNKLFVLNNISSSLNNIKLPKVIRDTFINQFSFSVDFQRDINEGDILEILYEANYTKNNHLVGKPELLYASMSLNNHKIELFRYKLSNGKIDYFDSSGKSIRKSIMRTPISGARLSSRFGMRKHPILGYSKMHRGVDFAARKGTPIMSAGDGRVSFAGRNGSYGKFLEIRHLNGFSTRYGHLHKFAKGIKKGKIVKQGQIVGYVGNTGRSTGSHLHYEVKHKNRIINPMTLKLPSRIEVIDEEMPNFYANVSLMRERLSTTPISDKKSIFARE